MSPARSRHSTTAPVVLSLCEVGTILVSGFLSPIPILEIDLSNLVGSLSWIAIVSKERLTVTGQTDYPGVDPRETR